MSSVRILMVSPYPPLRDGIAAYAVQSVRALRAAGNTVEVLSPGPSAAHHSLNLVGPRGGLALAKRVRGYDRVVVQFHPDFFYPPGATAGDRTLVNLALMVAFRWARSVEVVVHEINVLQGKRRSVAGQVARRLWHSPDLITVHTDSERDGIVAGYGVPADRIAVADHGAHFLPHTRHDRASARRTLGLPQDALMFLSIGFIQASKGFDRAVRAFAAVGRPDARLDIVGSVRVDDPDFLQYRSELADLVDRTDGVHLHEGFVSDELFDRWIVAADVLVLPYRSIWSSGVLERARLFGRPIIAADVGGLREQVGARMDATFVRDDNELLLAMLKAVGVTDRRPATAPWPAPGPRLQQRLQGELLVRAAAARGYRLPPAAAAAVAAGGSAGTAELIGASAPLRRVPPANLPAPLARDPLTGAVKRLVRRLTAWEVEPVVHHLNAVHAAAVEAIELAAQPGRGSRPPIPREPAEPAKPARTTSPTTPG